MIAIIDLDLGNLYSVYRAITHAGGEAVITDDLAVIANADKLILPGVGSYKAGMNSINNKNLGSLIKSRAAEGIPVLGICLGMQLLMDHSQEQGSTIGLGLVPGKVVHFTNMQGLDAQAKVPHINWCALHSVTDQKTNELSWRGSVLEGIDEGDECYFVHSLCVLPDTVEHILAASQYCGTQFASVIQSNNVVGCQFHPEKSGVIGLKIIENFVGKVKV